MEWTGTRTFGFYKMQAFSSPAEELLVSDEGPCFMVLIRVLYAPKCCDWLKMHLTNNRNITTSKNELHINIIKLEYNAICLK
jgi:hypothetical protein